MHPCAQYLSDRGSLYLKLDLVESAISDLSKAIEFEPKEYGSYMIRGDAYYQKNAREEALTDYRKVLQILDGDQRQGLFPAGNSGELRTP